MKKIFTFLLIVAIVAISDVFSQKVKYTKVTLLDGTVLPIKMNAINKIEVSDSTYTPLIDSLYRNIKGSWYEVSYKVSWTKNGPWETPAFTPNKNNYDIYLENNTTTSYANGNVIYRGYYYIDDKGNYVQIDSSGGVNLMEIKKLNGTDLELLFLDKTFFVHAFYKRL